MLQGVLIALAQIVVIVAGYFVLLPPGKDASTTKDTDMMILSMLVCDECHYPLTLGKAHRCPPKRFCLQGGCGTPFYSSDPSRSLCIVHAAFLPSGTTGGLAPGLLGVPAVQRVLDDIRGEHMQEFITAYDRMITRQEDMEGR